MLKLFKYYKKKTDHPEVVGIAERLLGSYVSCSIELRLVRGPVDHTVEIFADGLNEDMHFYNAPGLLHLIGNDLQLLLCPLVRKPLKALATVGFIELLDHEYPSLL